MKSSDKNILADIKVSRIFLPIVIGIGVVLGLLIHNFDKDAFNNIQFTWNSAMWLFIAVILMFGRDIGYMIRLRILSDNTFTWRQAFRVIMLWEFTSAVTPSAIGGTSLAVLYVHKEGVSIGKSSAIVMATSILDELYFILVVPSLILLIGFENIFSIGGGVNFQNEFFLFFIVGYSLKLVFLITILYGLFVNPKLIKYLVIQIFRLPILRRWKVEAVKAGDDIVVSSKELKKKSISFWLKAFAATILSWTSRYWVVNVMFLAFFTVHDHFLLMARQLIMWIMMLVSPTPGGSGFTEYIFSQYLSDFLPTAGIAILMALMWRLITYYPYLFAGAIIAPKWIQKHFKREKKSKA